MGGVAVQSSVEVPVCCLVKCGDPAVGEVYVEGCVEERRGWFAYCDWHIRIREQLGMEIRYFPLESSSVDSPSVSEEVDV